MITASNPISLWCHLQPHSKGTIIVACTTVLCSEDTPVSIHARIIAIILCACMAAVTWLKSPLIYPTMIMSSHLVMKSRFCFNTHVQSGERLWHHSMWVSLQNNYMPYRARIKGAFASSPLTLGPAGHQIEFRSQPRTCGGGMAANHRGGGRNRRGGGNRCAYEFIYTVPSDGVD